MPLVRVNDSLRFEEHLHEGVGYYLIVKQVLIERNGIQRVLLFESPDHGKVLTIDESIQLTEREEATYHEAIVHVPLFAHGQAERVLIVGGGDGGVAARVLMHPGVNHLRQIEIDETVVEISKEYLRSVHQGAFDDPRFRLTIGDGAEFIRATDERFDVIIVDCSDPDPNDSTNNSLFTSEFYENARRALRPGGVLVTQNGMPNLQHDELESSVSTLRRLFRYATCYLVDAPMYGGGNIAIGLATDSPEIIATPIETLRERFSASGVKCSNYTPEYHKAMFVLPKRVLEMLGGKSY